MSLSSQKRFARGLLFFSFVFFLVAGFVGDKKAKLHSLDFKTVYGASRCLLQGCDGYDSAQVYKAYRSGGGPAGQDERAFRPHESVYPPSMLALLTPFAVWPWQAAQVLWLAASIGVFFTGLSLIASVCLRWAPLPAAVALSLLLGTSTILYKLAQPTMLVAGLSMIGVWSLIERRSSAVGNLSLALALAVKPHVCGLFWLYFLLCRGEYRRRALRILLFCLLLSVPGIVWATAEPQNAHWLSSMRANIASLGSRGQINDPGPSNWDARLIVGLPTILSLFHDSPAFYKVWNNAVAGVFLILWTITTLRTRQTSERDYLAIGALVPLSFLVVYHRNYDVALIALVVPAMALLWQRRSSLRYVAFLVTCGGILLGSDDFNRGAIKYLAPHLPPLNLAGYILLQRSASWSMILVSLFYLGVYLHPGNHGLRTVADIDVEKHGRAVRAAAQ